ncbi:uncharacterized [Tachysurus ichikawai]
MVTLQCAHMRSKSWSRFLLTRFRAEANGSQVCETRLQVRKILSTERQEETPPLLVRSEVKSMLGRSP